MATVLGSALPGRRAHLELTKVPGSSSRRAAEFGVGWSGALHQEKPGDQGSGTEAAAARGPDAPHALARACCQECGSEHTPCYPGSRLTDPERYPKLGTTGPSRASAAVDDKRSHPETFNHLHSSAHLSLVSLSRRAQPIAVGASKNELDCPLSRTNCSKARLHTSLR